MQEHFVDYYICSVGDRVRNLTLRVRAQSENRDKVSVFFDSDVNMYFS